MSSRRRPGWAMFAAAAVAAAALAAAGWLWHRASQERWARETAAPQVERMIEAGDFDAAVALLRQARAAAPNDPAVETLWLDATAEMTIGSVPEGASVSFRQIPGERDNWVSLGQTPVKGIRLPKGAHLWRVVKPGFVEAELLRFSGGAMSCRLQPLASVPAGMVPVAGQELTLGAPYNTLPPVRLDDFQIDRSEVSNEEFEKFVAAGGYQRREFWTEPFVRNGRALRWEEAIAEFKDSTGRPGPATWEVGTYPPGKGADAVGGVSWYEAAAYAVYAHRELPSVYHWSCAAQVNFAEFIAPYGRFQNDPGGAERQEGALSGNGTRDMAGNMKEWCQTRGTSEERFIMGGGSGEPPYMFATLDVRSPWERRSNFGFRCAAFSSPQPAETNARLEPVVRDFSAVKPVSDEAYAAYKRLYGYDATELNATVDERETTAQWTVEKVSLDTVYGNERLTVWLFLPSNAEPPYQSVVYFPGSFAQETAKFDPSKIRGDIDFVVKSGRALVWPIYKSTFERRDGFSNRRDYVKQALYRDHIVMWSKDLGRTLDYVETRPELDRSKIAYVGYSWGAAIAPITLAVEPRIKSAILIAGGFYGTPNLPECDAITFAPRVTIPVLLLAGRYDAVFPIDSAQTPFFQHLGTPVPAKRHVLYDAGHVIPLRETIRETLDWLDAHLGPVKPKSR